MITSDFHMHTSYSTDSDTPPEEMIKGSINKGLKTICITDHYDQDYPYHEKMGEGAFVFEPDKYFRELSKLKEKYAGRIDVRIGVEIGLQPHLGTFYKELTSRYPFDFVIGSLHIVKGMDPYFQEIFKEYGDTKGYRMAFEEMLEDIKNIDSFDVLGHIDYVTRYGLHKTEEYSYRKYSDILDEILKTVIEKEKGIEMNMSGFKYGLEVCHPHTDVLKRYKELGGEIITVGADGHKPKQVAYDYEKAADILKMCGFKYYTEFCGRKPIFQQLP